ncbi:MAG: NAD-binding protein, partial [Methanomethylophilus sp.]
MKIVIVGAGNVGLASAEAAVRNNDVLVIEKDSAKAEIAKNTLPVSVLKEDGSNPKTLKNAIERINADVVLSAVPDDGANLFICMLAKQIKPTVQTVACIRNPDYLSGENGMAGVDLLISPETIAADKILHLALMENAVSYDDLRVQDLCLVTYRVERDHDLVGKVLMTTDLPQNCFVVAI